MKDKPICIECRYSTPIRYVQYIGPDAIEYHCKKQPKGTREKNVVTGRLTTTKKWEKCSIVNVGFLCQMFKPKRETEKEARYKRFKKYLKKKYGFDAWKRFAEGWEFIG